MQLHEKIRAWRIDRGYKQLYVAKQLGMGQQAYSKIELGLTKLTGELITSLAVILETPESKFYIDEEAARLMTTEKENEYLKKIIVLQDKDINHLEMIIELLKGNKRE